MSFVGDGGIIISAPHPLHVAFFPPKRSSMRYDFPQLSQQNKIAMSPRAKCPVAF
jgi:hypothetical protein